MTRSGEFTLVAQHPDADDADMWSPGLGYHGRSSRWRISALVLLFVSNILFVAAFLTIDWGLLTVRSDSAGVGSERHNGTDVEAVTATTEVGEAPRVWWRFGLWQCCRNDGFCLGTRYVTQSSVYKRNHTYTPFYSATRAFAVLALFGHVLAFAWMLGHTLEKLLDYDPCTMISLICLCFASASFSAISVGCFGVRWPIDFRSTLEGTETHLNFSFYMALATVPLTGLAGVFAVADFRSTTRTKARHRSFVGTGTTEL